MSHDMITRTLSSCKTDSRIGCKVFIQKAKTHKTNVSCLKRMPTSIPKRYKESSQTIQRSSSKRVRTCDGRVTRIRLIFQKPTGSRKKLFDERKKKRQERWLTVACSTNGRTERSNVITTCATCTTRWSLTRPLMGTIFVSNSMDLRSSSEPKTSASPYLRKTRPMFTSKGSTTKEVAKEGTQLFPCADETLKLFDLPPPPRGERPVGRNPEQDEKGRRGHPFRRSRR